MGQKVLTVEDRPYRARDNPNDPINTYVIFEYFRSICPPDQKRMFCRKHNQALKHKRRVHKDPIPYLTNPILPIGENTISKSMKRVAQICKSDNLEKCTNHGNRVYGVTVLINSPENKHKTKDILHYCRHNSLNSQLPYNCRNAVSERNLQNALSVVIEKPTITTVNNKNIAIASSPNNAFPESIITSTAILKSDKIGSDLKIISDQSRSPNIATAKL